ncbi:MAG: hypothetical protein KA965_04630 [Butyrivibrio sp.]|nr:hypothetical protein [Butyrivibrio sp.]
MKKNRIKKVLTGAIGTIVAATITGGTCTGTVFAAESAAGTENSVATEISQDMSSKTPPDAAGAATGGEPGGQAPGGGSSAVTEWTAAKAFTSDTTEKNGSYKSTGTDENAIHVANGANVVLNDPTVTRTSADSTGSDNASFYGVGAALLTTDGTTYVNGGTIDTDAAGGAGIFSYDKGVTYAAGTTINTRQDTSGGIHVAGGGTLYAWDVTATTQGESAAAIRSDRGGGTMVVNGGTYTSNGEGSPAIYCTADISVNDAKLTANGSEGICIEGLNFLRLFDSDLTSNMKDLDQNDSTWSVILYQSMSGDSEVGNSSFNMIGGSLNSENGGVLYTTNTECDILLNDVTITTADDSEYFLRVSGNGNERGWGTSGANGSQCNFTGISQVMSGDVIWDSISDLDFYMTDSSSLTGAVLDDETYAGNGGDGYCSMYVDSSSEWTVTGDSTLTNLYNEGSIVDAQGNKVSVVGTDGTVYVEGTSEYTITVDTYAGQADLSAAQTAPVWSDYEVAAPEQLTAVSSVSDAATGESSTDTEETAPVQTSESDTAASASDTEADGTNSQHSNIPLFAGTGVVAAVVLCGWYIGRRKK